MTPKKNGMRQVSCLILLASICIQMGLLPMVNSEREPPPMPPQQQCSSRLTSRKQDAGCRTTVTPEAVRKQNSSNEPAPNELFLVSRGIFVQDKSVAREPNILIDTSDHLAREAKADLYGGDKVWLASESLFDEDPVGISATPDDADLLQTVTNQTNGQPDRGPVGQQAADSGNYQNTGQLAGGSASELNQSFLSLFDELWLIKNVSANALIRLNYFGRTPRNRTGDQSKTNQPQDAISMRRISNQWAAPWGAGQHFNPNQNKHSAVASAKEQVVGRLQQAGLTIRGWLAGAQQRLTEVREKLATPFRWNPSAQATNRANPMANWSWLKSQATKPLDPDQRVLARPRVKRAADSRVQGDFDIVWQQQEALQAAPCNKLTIDEENKCRSMEQMVNSNLDDKFPGTMRAIEENCRHINHLLTNCWIQQSIQLRMSLSSRNESQQNFSNQPAAKKLGEPSAGLANSCGLEPSSPQYIRDRVSWMWLNLCIDRRFRLGYTSNLHCLSVWTISRAQQVCGLEYNRMQNYYSMSQTNGGQAVVALGISNTSMSASNSTPTSPMAARDLGDGAGSALSDLARDKLSRQANQTALVMAAATSAAGVSSSQLVAATTKDLSEAELVDREVSSKMLCCMFDQFLRCVYKQAVWECGKGGAQFVVDFMSRIGTDDMKYLCNADSKFPDSQADPPSRDILETTSTPLLKSTPNHSSHLPPTVWAGVPPVSISANVVKHRIPHSHGGQSSAAGNSHGTLNRNPFLENDFCVDSRIQTALASFNAATNINEPPLSSTSASPKVNPNRMRTPNYDPAYSDPRDISSGSAKIQHDNRMIALISFGSWLLLVDCAVREWIITVCGFYQIRPHIGWTA